MTLPLHPFCHRSSSGPHLLLPPIYNSVFIGLLGSILIHFKFFLSTVAYQSALEHRCDHITFLSLAPHWLQKKKNNKLFCMQKTFSHLLPHSVDNKPLRPLCHTQGPPYPSLIVSPKWLIFLFQDSVQMSPALKAFSPSHHCPTLLPG